MKRQLTVALGLAVLATPAFASKARLQALGEDVNGSHYINDNRNIFLNAAQLNNHKDFVTFEWGDTSAVTDEAASPRAEGGVFKTMGNLVYGVYLGGASNTSNGLRAAAVVPGPAAEVNEENVIDLFVAGDAGIKWGANVTYTKSSEDENNGDAEQSALRTRLGAIMGDLQAYANISISNEAQASNGNEFDGSLGYQIGAIQAWEGNSVFIDYRSFKGEADPAVGADADIEFQQLQAGIGRVTRLNDRANLFTRAQLTWAKAENDNGVAFGAGCSEDAPFACEEYKTTRIPVVVGLEYEATSWLTLRASVSQAIWGNEEDADNERGLHDTTVVNAGAGLKFGELTIDGVIGNSTDGTPAPGDDTAGGTGTLRTDTLMTRVAMTYRF